MAASLGDGPGGGGHVAVAADLVAPGGPDEVVAAAVQGLGGLDGLVANAGAGWAGPFVSMTPADLDGVIDLDLRAAAHVVHRALPHLIESGSGSIVLVGSIAGLLPVPGEAAYSAAKAGLTGLGAALRAELAPAGVSVSVVSPGVVATAFFDRRNRPYERSRPRPIPAERVAEAVVACLTTGRPEAVVPGWLRLPVRLRGALPGLYRMLSDRLG